MRKDLKKVSLKKALKLYGGVNIEIHNNYNYRSGFFEKNGQLYYFSTSDIRYSTPISLNNVLIRIAKDRNDYTGGANTYPFKSFLEENGLTLSIPQCKCDFN